MARKDTGETPDAYLSRLSDEVDKSDGIVAKQMYDLRTSLGWGRLGSGVIVQIHDQLAGKGLGHAPDPLPLDQGSMILIYRLGSEVAKLVQAVQRPSNRGADDLRAAATRGGAEVLAQIKALVCDWDPTAR